MCEAVVGGLLTYMMMATERASQQLVIQALARLPSFPWVHGVHHYQVMQMRLLQALDAQVTGPVEKEMDATLSAAALFLAGAKDLQLQQNFLCLAVTCTGRLVDGLERLETNDEDATRIKSELMFLWSQVLKVIIRTCISCMNMLRNLTCACDSQFANQIDWMIQVDQSKGTSEDCLTSLSNLPG